MKVRKVFNNSVVLGVDERGTELVLLGRGIGFQTSAGADVDTSLIEKTFVPGGSTTAERLAAFVDEIPLEDIEVTEEILKAARATLGTHITDHVLVPLADHVSFALRRAREGAAEIEYPLRWEIQYLYPAEVAFSRDALRIIEQHRGVRLPDLEAVPLALHFVNAQFGAPDLTVTLRMTEVLTETLGIIRAEYGIEIDEDSVPSRGSSPTCATSSCASSRARSSRASATSSRRCCGPPARASTTAAAAWPPCSTSASAGR